MKNPSTCTKSPGPWVVVGALVRCADASVRPALDALDGVSTFDLPNPDPDRIGVLVETSTIDAAHARIDDELRRVTGVLGVWPIALETDDPAHQDEEEEDE